MELIVFNFLNGNYAIELKKIKVILVYSQIKITPLFDEKPWVSGVINLRGEVTPIVDLRIKFSSKDVSFTDDTVVIVVKTSQDKLIGIIVDRIESIKEIGDKTLNPPPDLALGIDPNYISGLIKNSHDEMITLLDIDKILHIEALIEDAI
jgi:purine-binding chemotaxis protein CheW